MKRIAILFVTLCLLLSGCATWMDGSHVSVKAHREGNIQTEPGNVTVSSYREMIVALEDMVERGTEQGVIYLASLEQSEAEKHMDIAVRSVINTHPIGAYAVEQIAYDYGTNAGQPALAVNIEYRYDRSEIRRIRKLAGMNEVKTAIITALQSYDTSLVVRVKQYVKQDFEQFVQDYADKNPQLVIEVPQTVANVYPETGNDRVVELKFTYQTSREDLRVMQSRVLEMFNSAKTYVSGDRSQYEKFTRLYSWLIEPGDYTLETSITPAYSLLDHGVGDSKAIATVYAALCRQAGLECMVVSGTRAGEPWFWNMICDEGNYFHVDLLRCDEQGNFAGASDADMEGYVWDYSAYPQAGIPETPEATEPSEPTPTE